MNNLSEPLGLRSPDGREAQLLSVQMHAEVLGLMLRLTVRQTWRNTSGAPMATRMAFTLTHDQCLLELQAVRSTGPQAITHISRQSRDICNAGFGVMNTGEQVTVQWRIGQLLHLQGGSLRLQIPAASVPQALRLSRLSFEIHDPAAQGTLGATSHALQKVRHANGMTLNLVDTQGLDKDFSLTLHGLRDTGFALASPDLSEPEQSTVLTSHSLQLGDASSPQRLRLKLLVDHTGAIGSERQSQIQMALERLLASLQPSDQLSCSRLGATVIHDLPRLQPCTQAYVRRASSLMRHTEVVCGVADWNDALQDLIDIRDEDEESVSDVSILLITAHPIGSMDKILPTLRARSHRLHVMTVGSAASDSLWPVLAVASGGSAEHLGPGQHSQQTLQRLLDRMRSLRPIQAQLSVENQTLPEARHEQRSMAAGDTLHLWAQFEPPQTQADLTGQPEWYARMQWLAADEATKPQTTAPMPVLWDAEGDLTRLCAMRDVLMMSPGAERDQLITRHRLLVPDEGHMAVASAPVAPKTRLTAPVAAAHAAPIQQPMPLAQAKESHIPLAASVHPLRAPSAATATATNPVAALVHQFNLQAPSYTQFRAALSATLQRAQTRTVDGLVMQLARQAGNPGRVWALLLHFLHTEHELTLQDHALHLVEQELANAPLSQRNDIHAALSVAAITQPARRAA